MTYAPATITAAMKVWTTNGGLNGGIVGDAAHRARASYHNGQDAIDQYGRTAANDYSIRLARDREPYLTNAAAAMDLSHNTKAVLRSYSVWLVEQCKAVAPGTADVREVIYSPDGLIVRRWDNYAKKLYLGGDGTGQGDNTHLWHTHISFFRDSETRSKTGLFTAYFSPTPPPQEADVPQLSQALAGQSATVKAGRNIRTAPALTAPVIRLTAAVESWTDVVGWVKGDVDPEDGSDQWLTRWSGGKWEYTTHANLSFGPKDMTPYTETDLATAIVNDRAKARIVYP